MEIFHESECQWIQELSGAQISTSPDNCSLILSLWLRGHQNAGRIKIIKIKPIIILFWEQVIRYSLVDNSSILISFLPIFDWDDQLVSPHKNQNPTLCFPGPAGHPEYSDFNFCWDSKSEGWKLVVDSKTDLCSLVLPCWYFKVDSLRGWAFRINLLLSTNYIKNNMIMSWLGYANIFLSFWFNL